MIRPPATVVYVAWAPFFSGAERALQMLVENLDPSRYRPVVVVGTDGELAAALRARQIRTWHVPLVYAAARQLPSWLACVGKLTRIVRREGAAALHANDLPSFQPAGYVSRILRVPAICHIRFPDTATGFRWFMRPGFSKALFISKSLYADSVREAPGWFEDRSEIVYDGVKIPPDTAEPARVALRRELGLPMDRPVVALVGQVAKIKGLWEFLEAARALRGRDVPVAFAIVGDDLKNNGALRREAEQAVQGWGIADAVRFLGFRQDAAALMPAFDVVAVPSHVEPLGLSALEGMAAGRPVVGAAVGGIAETVVDNVTGLLVPPQDSQRLASAIETLALDRERREQYGRQGRARVAERFSVAAHATAVQAIYDRMLASR